MSAHDSEKKKVWVLPLRFSLVALAAIVLALVAGCGDSDDGGSNGSGGDAGELEGKTIGFVDVFATAPVQKRFYAAFEEAAQHAGWEVQLQDAAGAQGKALSATRNYLNSGVDAIVTSSVPSEWLRPIVSEAEGKDVPIVELITKGEPGVYTAEILEGATETSRLLAERVQEEFPEGAEVGITWEPEISAEKERLEGLESAFEGTDVKVAAVQEVPQAEAPATQKAVIDMLNANRNIDAFLTLSDIQTSYALAGLRSAGDSDGRVYSWYADTTNVVLLRQNPQLAAVVDSDIAKVGWIAVEELLKFFSGGEMTERQVAEVEPVIIEKADLTPRMFEEEGPVPFEQIAAPYYAKWKDEYGIGG